MLDSAILAGTDPSRDWATHAATVGQTKENMSPFMEFWAALNGALIDTHRAPLTYAEALKRWHENVPHA